MAGQEEELRELLINLIFNAVDALPQGGTIILGVRSAPASAEGLAERVVLQVSDDGIGRLEDVRQRSLEPFFTPKGKRGTGSVWPWSTGSSGGTTARW